MFEVASITGGCGCKTKDISYESDNTTECTTFCNSLLKTDNAQFYTKLIVIGTAVIAGLCLLSKMKNVNLPINLGGLNFAGINFGGGTSGGNGGGGNGGVGRTMGTDLVKEIIGKSV